MIELGSVRIVVGDATIKTTFSDGLVVHGDIAEQMGQAQTAASIGMTVAELNRTHDVTHSLLAHMLGLEHSPTLRAVAEQRTADHWEAEEAAVLAIQALAVKLDIDLIEAARKAAPGKDVE